MSWRALTIASHVFHIDLQHFPFQCQMQICPQVKYIENYEWEVFQILHVSISLGAFPLVFDFQHFPCQGQMQICLGSLWDIYMYVHYGEHYPLSSLSLTLTFNISNFMVKCKFVFRPIKRELYIVDKSFKFYICASHGGALSKATIVCGLDLQHFQFQCQMQICV